MLYVYCFCQLSVDVLNLIFDIYESVKYFCVDEVVVNKAWNGIDC